MQCVSVHLEKKDNGCHSVSILPTNQPERKEITEKSRKLLTQISKYYWHESRKENWSNWYNQQGWQDTQAAIAGAIYLCHSLNAQCRPILVIHTRLISEKDPHLIDCKCKCMHTGFKINGLRFKINGLMVNRMTLMCNALCTRKADDCVFLLLGSAGGFLRWDRMWGGH